MNISCYVKGNINSTAYYRIYQYFEILKEDEKVVYRKMYSDGFHDKYMPISDQRFLIKIIAYIHSYLRILYALVLDLLSHTNIIVIHKRLISRLTPLSVRILLILLKLKGVYIIWDFDDDLLVGKEMSKSAFSMYSKLSNRIIVTHETLKNLIDKKYWNKTIIMPTTDGDIYRLVDSLVNAERKNKLAMRKIILVWVATSGNLIELESCIKYIDQAARCLKEEKDFDVFLVVVCDKSFTYNCKNLKLINRRWSRSVAIKEMLNAHIGIMPLRDNAYNRGKGGFKLIQYLSAGLPCIASATGFNKKIIDNENGYAVGSNNDWYTPLLKLSDQDNWERVSANSYKSFLSNFSFQQNLNVWKSLLRINLK